MKKFLFLFAGILSILFCTNKKSSDKEKQIALIGFLASSSSTFFQSQSQSFTCNTPNPSFSSLAQAGTTNNCANCHGGSNPQANFDVTSYSSVLSRVQSGNPEGSLLYQKITTGSMKQNSTQQINQAVYCWIKGGANP